MDLHCINKYVNFHAILKTYRKTSLSPHYLCMLMLLFSYIIGLNKGTIMPQTNVEQIFANEKKVEKKMALYRPIKFKEVQRLIADAMSERRQMWVLIGKWLLTVCTLIPLSVYEWRWFVWGGYLLLSLLGLYVWDYFSHLRHVSDYKGELQQLAIKNDQYEQNFVLKRPDTKDHVAPYVIYTVCSLVIIFSLTMVDIYHETHGDSPLIEILKSTGKKSPNKTLVKMQPGL